jgi:hypothetical protein
LALRLGLDAFRRRGHVAGSCDIHHRLHDRGRAIDLDVADEAAIDLDLVEREALQIAQRGEAGAEIVERNAHADGAELMQDCQRRLVVTDQHRLGDFDLQPARLQSGSRERAHDPQRQRLAFQLDRRDVDGNANVGRPSGGFGAGGPEHPIAELVNKSGIFRHRDEFGGRDHAAFGMAPAQQRLAARDRVAVKIEQRLIVELEAAIGHGLTQVLLHCQPRLGAGVHFWFEEAMGAAPFGLGGIHCEIGVLDQLIEVGTVLRCQRNADAGVGGEMMAEAVAGLPDGVMDSRDEFHHIGGAADRGPDHGEFVAAEPRDQIAPLEATLDAAGNRLQQLVADMMSERVVDALELVNVDIEQGELLALLRFFELALDLLAEQHPVGQLGQRVVMGEVRDLFRRHAGVR